MNLIKILMTAVIFSILITSVGPGEWNNYFTHEAKAATIDEINNSEVFLKQINGDMQCTLVATAMMIRRAAMLSGNTAWADITVAKVREQAWLEGVGLKHSFRYEDIAVTRAVFGSDPVNESIALLKQHPEGIVLYDPKRSPRPHAVLLTDYTNGEFFSADPSDAVPSGRIPNALTLVQVKDAKVYWYVSSPSIALALPSAEEESTQLSALDINTYPVNLSGTSFLYDGTEKTPTVTISGLTENVDYTVSYFNNVNPGSASIVITGIGIYSGTIVRSFEIMNASGINTLDEVKFVVTKDTIKKGKTATIKATMPDSIELVKEYSGDPLRTNNEIKISYTSDNKEIASVNSKGRITGRKAGTTKVYATVELADGTRNTVSFKIKVK